MASSTPHTIVLRGKPQEEDRYYGATDEDGDAAAGSSITPGQLLEYTSGDLQEHATAGGNAQKMVAVENPFDDDTTSAAIDSDYAVAESVWYIVARTGDVLYMWLASGENVSKGDPLESDGNGDLQAFATAADAGLHDNLVGYAQEDVNAAAARARIKVRIA